MGIENEKVEEKKEDKKISEKLLPQWRKVIILTNGDQIKVENPEVAGRLEMIAILKEILKFYEK